MVYRRITRKVWVISALFLLSSAIFAGPKRIKIYLIGDSTMSIKERKAYPESGWGMPFAYFFDSTVVVDNRAQNGRSTKTFIEENRWKPVVDSLQEGDYVFIQFGHNDEVKTKKSFTTESEFKTNLMKYVMESKQKKAIPILLTPVARRTFDNQGQLTESHKGYSEIVRQVALENNVQLIDLDKDSQALLKTLGPEDSKFLYNHLAIGEHPNYPQGKQDNTHFNELGARKMAEIVLENIRILKLPLAENIVRPANAIEGKLPVIIEPKFKKDTFDITKWGAISDGVTLNTKSINEAITQCNAKGGGVVLVPNGLWLTGPVEMKSNVNLHLEKNATLLFTKDKSQYGLIESNWEGVPAVRNQSPIWGNDLENIAITGKGIIDGNGDVWRAVRRDKLNETQWHKLVSSGGVVSEDGKNWYPSEQYKNATKLDKPGVLLNGKKLSDFKDYKDFFRPNITVLMRCKKVLIEGPIFQNSAAWGLHPLMCENVTVRDVFVKNPWYAQNGDGIDVESCSNVLIENSTFDVGDDGICIKSGRDEEGRKRGVPTQNLIARNCIVYHAHGGFVIGSEMSGSVKNMFVENCTFIGTDIGLRFKTTRGRGGVVENVYVKNVNMKDIVGEAILFDMYYMAKDPVLLAGEKRETPKVETIPVTDATPQFKGFYIENVVCDGAEKGLFIRGLPEMNIQDIHFKNVTLQAKKGIEITEAQNISLDNVKMLSPNGHPVVSLHNASKIRFDGFNFTQSTDLLFHVSGTKTADVKVTHTDTAKAKTKITYAEGVLPAAIDWK